MKTQNCIAIFNEALLSFLSKMKQLCFSTLEPAFIQGIYTFELGAGYNFEAIQVYTCFL